MVSDTERAYVTPGPGDQKVEAPMPAEAAGPPEADADVAPAEALRGLGQRVGELKDYASYYLSARLDGIKVSARNLAVYAALGVAGLIAGGALLVTAVVLAVVGLAGLLNALINIGGHAARAGVVPALGYLIVGVLALAGVGLGAWWFMNRLFNTSRRKTIEKYENRQRQQVLEYGTNVHDRAHGG